MGTGVVVAVGPRVSKFVVGDRVFGMMDFQREQGTLAQYVVSNEAILAKIPGVYARRSLVCAHM